MKNIKHTFFPKNDKMNPSGEVPIYCKIKVDGTVTTFPTKKFVDPKRWEMTKQFRVTRDLNEKQTRNYFEAIIKKIENIEEKLQENGKGYNAQIIKNELLDLGNQNKSLSLLQAWDKHKEDYLNQIKNGERKASSYKKYHTIRMKVKEFLEKEMKLTDIPLNALDDNFGKKLHGFFKKTLTHNVAIKYLIITKSIVKFAVNNKFLEVYPFIDTKMKLEKKEKVYLTLEEISAIANKEFETERLRTVRDCFLFSCYTGYCFADTKALTEKNLFKHGNDILVFKNREKTKVQAKVKLIPKALALVEKYRHGINCIVTGKLFPMKSNQKMNEYLKEIAILCGIDKHLTWHVARFSFAKICMESNMDIKVLSEALGHSSLQQTIHYTGQFSNHKVVEEMEKLELAFA
jgi:site-specific recombinase XerD